MIAVSILLCIVLVPVVNHMATFRTKQIVDALKNHDVHELEAVLQKCKPSDINRNEHGIFERLNNIIQADTWCPLEYACANGTLEEMEVLIDHGADVNIGGSYMLDIALTRGDDPYKAANLLIENGIDVDQCGAFPYFDRVFLLVDTCEERKAQLDTFKSIVEHSHKKDSIRGYTILSDGKELIYTGFLEYSIEASALDAVKMLVEEFDFDVNKASEENGTPLALAKKLGEEEICNYLISKGAHE